MKRIIFSALLLATPLCAQPANPDPIVIGPDYAPAPETIADPGVPAGTVREFFMDSADSRIYPGIARIENDVTKKRDAWGNRMPAPFAQESHAAPYKRAVWVYVPKQYVPGRPAPVLIVQDGNSYRNRLPVVLDNLIAAKRIPAMIAVMADSGGSDAQGSERGLEYDTISGRFSDFVEKELLPRAAKEAGVVFTRNPEGRAVMGGSSGAAAAFTMAWFHPERYRRVLSYSGTFVNQQSPENGYAPRGAWEYHDHLIARSPKKPIRIWMEVGEDDLHSTDPEESWHNWPLANRRMAAVLGSKGYAYRFTFARGAHHVDPRVVAQTLPGALEWLWQGYKE